MNKNRPSTFGGSGFISRNIELREEIGKIWSQCGVNSEGEKLRQVVVARPGNEMLVVEPPNQWLMLEHVDLPALQKEADQIAKYYKNHGIITHRIQSPPNTTPNWIFLRDLFWMTNDGAYLARMAAQQRAGEEIIAQQFLSKNGFPQIGMPRGTETFEGADALWLNHRTILLGEGNRSNSGWRKALEADLSRGIGGEKIKIIHGLLPKDCQHLLGVVNFISPDRAAVWEQKTPSWVIEALQDNNISLIPLPNIDEMSLGRAMNWVCIKPDHIVMPKDCPQIAEVLQNQGITVDGLSVNEFRKVGGALGCLTGIIERSN